MKWIKKLEHVFPVYTLEILVVIGLVILFIVVQLFEKDAREQIQHVSRNDHIKGATYEEYYFQYEGGEEQKISLDIQPLAPTQEEIDTLLDQTESQLRTYLMNQTFHLAEKYCIESPMSLPSKMDLCTVDYYILSDDLMNDEGWYLVENIHRRERIELSYKMVYPIKGQDNLERTGSLYFDVHEKAFSDGYLDQYGAYRLHRYFDAVDDNNETMIEVPDGYVLYDSSQQVSKLRLFLLIPIIICLLSGLSYLEKKQRELRRKAEYRIHVTYLVSIFLLFYRTGQTLYKSLLLAVMNRLDVVDKESQLGKDLTQIKVNMENDLNLENTCRMLNAIFEVNEIHRFTRLISQNQKLGDDQLGVQLEMMTKDLWETRLHGARKISEKASTKLVIPMVLVFIIILLITIVPAFMEVDRMI